MIDAITYGQDCMVHEQRLWHIEHLHDIDQDNVSFLPLNFSGSGSYPLCTMEVARIDNLEAVLLVMVFVKLTTNAYFRGFPVHQMSLLPGI